MNTVSSRKHSKRQPTKTDIDRPVRVVGIGASAGGLEAFSDLLRYLPKNTGMAFVFIQHLESKQISRLSEILPHVTKMPVEAATDNLKMQRDHVYVMPAAADLSLHDGMLKVQPRTESPGRHLPINEFFRSLAQEQQQKAIAVVLSGMGDDGTAGLKLIKENGGITLAQTRSSAQQDSMPAAAINSGQVDIIGTPQQLAAELKRIAEGRAVKRRTRKQIREDAFQGILTLLHSRTDVDFSQYRRTTVRRRMQRRMLFQRLESLDDYLSYMKKNPDEVDLLYREMLIHVTEFFRKPETFETLKSAVFPRLLEKRGADDAIRVWLPGCSTGEEAYSLAIAITEFFDNQPQSLPIQIFATDVSQRVLEIARKGVFEQGIEQQVSRERLGRFFRKVKDGYQIDKQIRDLCIFARQNMLRDPAFSRLDLVSCRNVLIYFELTAQKKIIQRFHYALKPGGFLLLGEAETVAGCSDLFESADAESKLFVRRSPQSASSASMNIEFSSVKNPYLPDDVRRSRDVAHRLDEFLLSEYCPPSITVSSDLKIIQFRGNVAPFVDPRPGEASLDLFHMIRSSLEMPLRTAITGAQSMNAVVRKEKVALQEGGTEFVNLRVIPMARPVFHEKCFLLLFEKYQSVAVQAPLVSQGKKIRGKAAVRVAELEQKLANTEGQLQSLIEDQESSNEELRSANEEIQSSNEELQSTNEELATAKEELQSTNEELVTLNEQLKKGNLELNEVNNDLMNLLRSVNIPIVMIDRDLRIRRFTPVAQKTLKLIPADIGRSITDLRSDIEVPRLQELMAEVMNTLRSKDIEIQDRNGHWFNLQIRPYETADNKISGIVLILFDIHLAKLVAAESKAVSRCAEALVEAVRNCAFVLDKELKVVRATPYFYEQFQMTPQETEGVLIFKAGNGQWNIPALRNLLEERLSETSIITDFEIDHEFSRVGPKRLLLNARRVDSIDPDDVITLISIEPDEARSKAA